MRCTLLPVRNAHPEPSAAVARAVLRVAVGATVLAHGVRHARSLPGTAGWFGSIGFRSPQLQARLSAAVEAGAGIALLAGAATPIAASAVVGTMAVAAEAVHRRNGFFITDEGWEHVALLGAAALAVGSLGAGALSVDRATGWDARGSAGTRAVLVLALGTGAAAGQLRAFWARPGLSSET